MDDIQIIDMFFERNERAIEETDSKYGRLCFSVANRILDQKEDSEECVNDTYLAAWNSMPTNRPNVLSTYLSKITRQITIDLFRKKNRLKRYASEYAISLDELGDSFSDSTTPEQELDTKLLIEAINRFLRSLSAEQRTIFIGRYYYMDSIRDISSYYGMTEAKIKMSLHRTRIRLKQYLNKEGFEV